MTTMQIHLQDDLKVQLTKRAAESGFATIEAYVESLLRADAGGDAGVADDALESLLLNRIDSDVVELTPELEKQFKERIAARRPDRGTEQ